MTRHDQRPLLTRDEQADEVLRIQSLARAEAAIVRCDGTLEEHRAYLAGSDDPGWEIAAKAAKKYDLLLSSIVVGATRMLVSFSRVERVEGHSIRWSDDTDVALRPAVHWQTVMQRTSLGRKRAWPSLTGAGLAEFVDALVETLRSDADESDTEGDRQLTSCRSRSPKNRALKLLEAEGVCSGCDVNLREPFGTRGDRGLEVHHLTPLSDRPEGPIETPLSDLVVLCATCHRLIHADPEHSLEALQASWAIGI